jgi:taurine--2-oxoglutarate transaminase
MKEPIDAAETTRRHTYGTWRKQKGWAPLDIVDAEGCFFTDSTGKRYFDLSSQLICSNLGHKNKAVMDAIAAQAVKLPYVHPAFTCEARAQATRSLLEVLPRGLEKFFFSTSGTEANEAALKIARVFTGKRKVVSRHLSYHGSTAGSLAVTGDFRRWYVEGQGGTGSTVFAPDAYCYRCPMRLRYPECGVACADYVEHMIKREGDVAAVIVEPIVGTNGVIVPPDEYLPMLREITERNGVLLIADEVMTGWGRTGSWLAVDHWKVKPDIVTIAKGVTAAYIPLGVTATNGKIADYFEEHYFPHGHTYEAHPLSLSAVPAVISEYRRLNLMSKVKKDGEYLGRKLRDMASGHPSVGDVRGLGLFWGVELVRDKAKKTPFNTMQDKFDGKDLDIDKVTRYLMEHGVYVMGSVSHLIIAPPLIVTRPEIDSALGVLNSALEITDKMVDTADGPARMR